MSDVDQKSLELDNNDLFFELEKFGGFDIKPCDNPIDLKKDKYSRLKLTSEQKIHFSALLQQIPSVVTSNMMSQMYMVKFPLGLPHTLTTLNQGGFGSMIQGIGGGFVGTASFYSLATPAALLAVFNTMSIASGQYFLSEINSELKMMRMGINKILEFLYGDKKAELMAEVSFVKYAYENYSSMMLHEEQRIATIASLQESKKIAMKDIEFYICDLDTTVSSNDNSNVVVVVNDAFQIKESLDLSIQLYCISFILEVYYSRNQDLNYLKNIEKEMTTYITKCEKRMLSSFSMLNVRVKEFKGGLLKKIDKASFEKAVSDLVDNLNSGEESSMCKTIQTALQASMNSSEFYIDSDGDVYIKK